jgi:hypothetical protein
MNDNYRIDTSGRLFALLLNLYPRAHRDEFAVSMRQVFKEQCREASRLKGSLGILFLWLRTLPDLARTAIMEHLTTPGASWGLMEPVPNAPLPWKGVLLILLPGLVYLVSQIAQLTGQPWYLTVYYRAAFFLILPPLAVWIITRRFPLWGLIPVGLLFRLLQEIGYQLVTLHPNVFSSNPVLNAGLDAARMLESNPFIASGIFAAAILLLGWRFLRKSRPARGFWLWGGVCLAVALTQIGLSFRWIIPDNLAAHPALTQADAWIYFWNSAGWSLYTHVALLLLVFLGTLFTRRHGMFAILVLVGYLLPTLVIGTPWNLGDNGTSLVMIFAGILTFRGLLSLVMPVWMSRTPSQNGKRGVVIGLALAAFIIHGSMQFLPDLFYPAGATISIDWVASVLLDELKGFSALLLGLALYAEKSAPAAPKKVLAGVVETKAEMI